MWHLYFSLSGTTDQRLARARQERSAAASLRLPTARRASAQSRETTTTTTNCWSILRIVSSMLKRCSESVTEPSAMKGCLAYRLRREAFAYVRAPYGPMVYHLSYGRPDLEPVPVTYRFLKPFEVSLIQTVSGTTREVCGTYRL